MPWINTNGATSEERPTRVRLADHTTLTGSEVTDFVLTETGWSWAEPAPAPKPAIVALSMRQARLALLQAGLLSTVDAAISAMDEAARIEWEYATEVRRDNPLMVSMASSLGLTDEQVDALFSSAAQL